MKNTLLHDQWVIKEIRVEIKNFLEFNKSESTTYLNLWDIAMAVLWGMFVVMGTDIKSTEGFQSV
jgi:hypothetical protein